MAKRKSSIAQRISKMRGVPSEEKHLLERVGTIIDAQINNRSLANPQDDGVIRADKKLPPPRNVVAQGNVHTAQITWPAVDASILSHYEVQITNIETGEHENFIVFTNNFIFKGRAGGEYTATVRSVGRNGTKSFILEKVDFTVSDNIFLLEGSKNDFNTIGVTVSEDLFLFANDTVHIWGACEIDKLIGDSDTGNAQIFLQLSIGDEGSSIEDSTLLQEIPLFFATETFTCLDNTALGGISRPTLQEPAASDPDYIRGSSFETTYSVMFAPYSVPDEFDSTTKVFFLRALGRETQADVTGLSITLWESGRGTSEIKSLNDPTFTTEPDIVTEHDFSIHLNPDAASNLINSDQAFQGDDWVMDFKPVYPSRSLMDGTGLSVAGWVKFDGFPVSLGTDAGQKVGDANIIQMMSLPETSLKGQTDVFQGGEVNGFRLIVHERYSTSTDQVTIQTNIELYGKDFDQDGDVIGDIIAGNQNRGRMRFFDNADDVSTRPDFGEEIPYNDSEVVWTDTPGGEPSGHTTFGVWHFFTFTWEPGEDIRMFVNGAEMTHNSNPGNDNATNMIMTNDNPYVIGIGIRPHLFFSQPNKSASYNIKPFNHNSTVIRDENNNILVDGNSDGLCAMKVHRMGVWNTAFGPASPSVLAVHQELNDKDDWRTNGTFYEYADNLVHYWQFGAATDELRHVGRDTGFGNKISGEHDGLQQLTGRRALHGGAASGEEFDPHRGYGPGIDLNSVVEDAPDTN